MCSLKVKQRREDFVVTEVSNGYRTGGGPFTVYTLEKSGIGTVEAIEVVKRDWDIAGYRTSFGGRKDRHAVTTQTVTIKDGPTEDFPHQKFSLRYRGQAAEAFTAKDIEANHFQICMRNLTPAKAEACRVKLQNQELLTPNYFDEQRFGSVGQSGDFVAQPWCQANYERAVFLALAEANSKDSQHEAEQKELLRENWGDWIQCKELLSRSNRRSVVTYLCDHPEGFKKAAGLISRDMRSLYVAAFQAAIWNEIVSRWIKSKASDVALQSSTCCQLAFPTQASDFQGREKDTLPLPSSRPTKWAAQMRSILEKVCSGYDLKPHKLRFSFPRDVFFSRAARPLFLQIDDLDAVADEDELNSSADTAKSALRLDFSLQAGQYATMLLRTLENF